MKTEKCAICPICGAGCGLIVEVENNAIVRVRGDRDDPNSRGHVCPKGMSLPALHADPDRIREPLKRGADGSWEPVAWDAALDEIAGRMARVIAAHGRDAVAIYAGDATTHHYAAVFAMIALQASLNTRNFYTANSMDALPHLLSSSLMFGNPGMLPVPDITRTAYLLILGGNPAVTNGSVMIAPGFARHLRDIQRRGGRVVVVDPRRHETAAFADEHHYIRPGSDALLLLAIINTIFEERRDRPGVKARGREELRRLAREFTPEGVEGATGIAPDAIRKLARDFSSSPTAVCYGRMGVCAQEFGTTAAWLITALNAVTGNLDRPGGAMFPSPVMDLAELMPLFGIRGGFGRWRTRVSGLPEFNGELPAVAMASEIETPGPRQIRALLCVAGNPAVSVPDSAQLGRALEKLELMVALSPHLDATSRHAHYILPPVIGLEHDYFPLIAYGTAVRNTAKYAPAALSPPPGVRPDWETLWALARRLAARRAGLRGPLASFVKRAGSGFDPTWLLKALLAMGPYGARAMLDPARRRIRYRDLMRNPHGIDLGLHTPRLDRLMHRREIELVPAPLAADLPRLHRWREAHHAVRAGDGALVLVSRRQRRFMNTYLHNIPQLAAGPEQCSVEMHPEDAAARGLKNGDHARMHTKRGEIVVEVAVTAGIMRGVVCVPFGWNGRQPHHRMAVADRHPGANVNDITDATRVNAVSGMSAFNGTPVTVGRAGDPAAGPSGSWNF